MFGYMNLIIIELLLMKLHVHDVDEIGELCYVVDL